MAVSGVLMLMSLWSGMIVSPMEVVPQSQRARQRVAPSAADKEKVTRGEAVFSKHCPICHLGRPAATRPFVGRNLRGILKNAKPEQEAAVRAFILKGGDKMPGFQYNLTPAQIEDLIGYLKTYN